MEDQSQPKKSNKVLLIILLILLIPTLVAAVYFGYLYFTKDTTTTDTTDTSEPIDTETEDADATDLDVETDETETTCEVPESWEIVENTSQGYTAYRPGGWYFKFFGPSRETLGIDPGPIPDASEYAGVISFNFMQQTMTDYISGIVAGYTDTTETIGLYEWNLIEGTEEESLISDEREAKFAFTEVDGVGYVAIMKLSDISDYLDEFDTFLCSVEFE